MLGEGCIVGLLKYEIFCTRFDLSWVLLKVTKGVTKLLNDPLCGDILYGLVANEAN